MEEKRKGGMMKANQSLNKASNKRRKK